MPPGLVVGGAVAAVVEVAEEAAAVVVGELLGGFLLDLGDALLVAVELLLGLEGQRRPLLEVVVRLEGLGDLGFEPLALGDLLVELAGDVR